MLAVLHLLAAAAVLLALSAKPLVAALLLLLALTWYRAHRRYIQHCGKRVLRRLVWQSDGRWLLDDTQAVAQPARLLPSSYLHPRLVILNLELAQGRGRRSVVLLPDSLDTQTLRRLRRRMRIEAVAEKPAGLNRA